MILVSLAQTQPHYAGLAPPFGPGSVYPETQALCGSTPAASPNHVYAAVRAALRALDLDAQHFGSPGWNPLSSLVARGAHVVLKPNFIRHWNPCNEGSLESVITHGSVVRAMADYAFLAVGAEGRVSIAEAPQHDCDFDAIRAATGLDEIVDFHARRGRELHVIDLRRESVTYRDGTIVERRALPGDPRGYRLVDLGSRSHFEGSGLDPQRFRGADYDPGPTADHHTDGRNEYLLSETVLSADLVVNLPKIKTHKKTGVTLALKNLVGINGDKNLLPHHCVGSEASGGDEFPGGRLVDLARSRATEVARRLLARGAGTRLVRAVRRVERATRGDDFIRSGNWYRNRTTWRMCLDLNACLYYSDVKGEHFDADRPVRRVLSVADGVVAGEGEGPLAPRDRPLGCVIASLDPVALDLVAVRLMGLDEERLPKVCQAMRSKGLRVTDVHSPEDVVVARVGADDFEVSRVPLADLGEFPPFLAHSGWRGFVERGAGS